MKKYTDWQKYVKEQTEKLNRMRPERDDQDTPLKQVPEIDNDRFVIRRKDAPTGAQAEPRESAPRQRTQPQTAPEPRKPFSSAAPQHGAAPQGDEPANPITSPFVSVQDVWKSAEKSTRKKPSQQQGSPGGMGDGFKARAARVPEISRVKPGRVDDDAHTQPLRDESRDEILERLMNPTITLEEAAKIMGVCKATVRRYTVMGILPHYRTPGNQRRFKLNDIISFLENQRR